MIYGFLIDNISKGNVTIIVSRYLRDIFKINILTVLFFYGKLIGLNSQP